MDTERCAPSHVYPALASGNVFRPLVALRRVFANFSATHGSDRSRVHPEERRTPSLGAFMRLSKMLPAFTAATAITAGVLAAPRVLTDLHWRMHSAARADSDA